MAEAIAKTAEVRTNQPTLTVRVAALEQSLETLIHVIQPCLRPPTPAHEEALRAALSGLRRSAAPALDASGRWDGRPPENGDRSLHWIERRSGDLTVMEWHAAEPDPCWFQLGTKLASSPGFASKYWRYAGRCLPPAFASMDEAA